MTHRLKSIQISFYTAVLLFFWDQKLDSAFFWSTTSCTIVLTTFMTVSTADLALLPLWRSTDMDSEHVRTG